jgi:hypothetical protein
LLLQLLLRCHTAAVAATVNVSAAAAGIMQSIMLLLVESCC